MDRSDKAYLKYEKFLVSSSKKTQSARPPKNKPVTSVLYCNGFLLYYLNPQFIANKHFFGEHFPIANGLFWWHFVWIVAVCWSRKRFMTQSLCSYVVCLKLNFSRVPRKSWRFKGFMAAMLSNVFDVLILCRGVCFGSILNGFFIWWVKCRFSQ